MDSAGVVDRGQLEELARREGASVFGVADVSKLRHHFAGFSEGTLEGVERAVCAGYHLSDAVIDDLVDGPTKLYYFHYQRVNLLLDAMALKLAALLQAAGRRAVPIPASQVTDWQRQRGQVSHKHVAVQAGLGWIGRNNLLIHPRFGARLRLVSVLTDAPLEADAPLDQDCGTCRECIASCPAGAIAEDRADFDHVGCYEQIKALVKAAGIGHNVCGLCIKACRGRR